MTALERLYAANLKRLSEQMKEISGKLEQGEEYEEMWRDLDRLEVKISYCTYLREGIENKAEKEAEKG